MENVFELRPRKETSQHESVEEFPEIIHEEATTPNDLEISLIVSSEEYAIDVLAGETF